MMLYLCRLTQRGLSISSLIAEDDINAYMDIIKRAKKHSNKDMIDGLCLLQN